MSRSPSLVEVIQRLLERTYRMDSGVRDLGRFIVGDAGYLQHYGTEATAAVGARDGGAATLVRQTSGGVRASIYYPDRLIHRLERHPPHRGLHEDNVDAFATLVEELDHLLVLAERARQGRPVTLFELELHANVSKHLVVTRFVAGDGLRVSEPARLWVRHHLFEKAGYCDPDRRVRQRYREAARWAVKLLEAVRGMRPRGRLAALRRFHVVNSDGKVQMIAALAG